MNEHDHSKQPDTPGVPEVGIVAKRTYQKPAFRHERVFETRALICGKVQTTQESCHSNRKTS